MTSHQLTPNAERDVEDIWDFLSHDSAGSADHVIASLRSAFELIGKNPGIGHKRQDFTDESVLFWPVGKYPAIYRETDSKVRVVAVVHGARNIPSFLRKRKAKGA